MACSTTEYSNGPCGEQKLEDVATQPVNPDCETAPDVCDRIAPQTRPDWLRKELTVCREPVIPGHPEGRAGRFAQPLSPNIPGRVSDSSLKWSGWDSEAAVSCPRRCDYK